MKSEFMRIGTKLAVIILALLIISRVYAQTAKVMVSGVVVCNEVLPGVTVQLLGVEDSTFVGGGVTDQNGCFKIRMKPGVYILSTSMMGYKRILQEIKVSEGVNLDTLFMEEESMEIDEVTVTGVRNMIEYSAGKVTVDPSASILTSQGNMFDALKCIPGVVVSEDGTIMLNGQTGVKVQVNGKDSHLSGVALTNLLKSTAASSVNKIDVIANPTAEYDAAGKAGIVNIRLKKPLNKGVTFSTNVDYQQWNDTRGNIWMQSIYRKGKAGIGCNYYHFEVAKAEDGVLFREYGTEETVDTFSKSLQQHLYLKNNDRTDDITLFGDVDVSEHVALDAYVNGNFFHRSVPGGSEMSFFDEGVKQDTVLNTETCSRYSQTKYNGGVRGQYKGKNDVESDLSVDYLAYTHKEKSEMFSCMNRGELPMAFDSLFGDLGGDINIFSVQGNYSRTVSKRIKVKGGFKSVWTDIDNYAIYKNPTSEGAVINSKNSCRYAYNENISAGYIQVEGKVGKWGALVGLRVENTDVKGTTYGFGESANDTSYRRRDCDLFPTIGILYTVDDNQNVSMIYNRRITRPNYRDLSPFNYVADEYTRTAGNPNLRAEMTHNLEFAYVFGKMYRVSMFGMYTSDIIVQGIEKRGDGGFLAYPQNLASSKRVGLKLDAGRLVDLKWWKVNSGMIVFWMENKWQEMDVGYIKSSVVPMFNMSSQFLLPKNWSVQLTGHYNGDIPIGQIGIPETWTVDGGIRKKWADGKMSLSFYMNDIFFSVREKSFFKVRNMAGYSNLRRDETSVGVSFYYHFSQGKIKEKQNERRKMEESSRINF